MEAVFLWCLIWSFGAALLEGSQRHERSEFDVFIKGISRFGLVDSPTVSVSHLPARSLFDYNFDLESLQWRLWDDYLTPYAPPPSGKFREIFVPTVDAVRSHYSHTDG